MQPPSEKHDFMYVGRAPHLPAPWISVPQRGRTAQPGVRSKQNARKEHRSCMCCVTRRLTGRACFCRSAEQGCLSSTEGGENKHTRHEGAPPGPELYCAVPRSSPQKKREPGRHLDGLIAGKIQICMLAT